MRVIGRGGVLIYMSVCVRVFGEVCVRVFGEVCCVCLGRGGGRTGCVGSGARGFRAWGWPGFEVLWAELIFQRYQSGQKCHKAVI